MNGAAGGPRDGDVAWVTAVPEWPHCVAALGGDGTLGLAGLLVILGCDGAQVWLSWTESSVSAAASQLARGQVPATHPLGAQGGDPESLWPVLALGGYFPSKLSLSQGGPSKLCPLPLPGTPTATHVTSALSSPRIGPYWGVGRGRVPSMTTSYLGTHRPVARGPADPSNPKYIKGVLGLEGPATGCREDQGLPPPFEGLPRNGRSHILSLLASWG